MFNVKKNILILVCIGILFGAFASFALADRALEISYPDILNAIKPTTIKTLLTDYIKYIFSFALMLAGLIAFGSVAYGGIHYVASAGSPSSLTEAKSRITSGILGLVVLFASYLILTTVNPQLVIFTPSAQAKWGIIIYKGDGCVGDSKDITKDTPDLGNDPVTGFNNNVASLKFRTLPGMLDIDIYPDSNYGSASTLRSYHSDNQSCINVGGNAKSIRFIWRLPGVYLVKNNDEEKFLPSSTATIEDFNDKVKGIKFNNTAGVNYGAVLHENQDFKGECSVFKASDDNLNDNIIKDRTSSVTTFVQSTDLVGGGVTFYENDNFGGRNFGTYKDNNVSFIQNIVADSNDQVTSLTIQGNYIAVLFDNENYGGTCQVFTKNDPNLRDDPIGRCRCGPFGWGCVDCLSSFMIIPTK